jgi:hypothetical protein
MRRFPGQCDSPASFHKTDRLNYITLLQLENRCAIAAPLGGCRPQDIPLQVRKMQGAIRR